MNKALLLAVPAVLLLLSCQTNTVGLGCTVDSDCDMGQSCFMNGFMGGFCTKGCIQPGGTNECPGGTVCTETADGLTIFCSVECDNSSCRDGYTCAMVPQSTHSACRP